MASQGEIRAFEEDQSEGVPLPSADLNPDLSKAIEEFNPANAFQAPSSIPASQIKDSDISSIIHGAMEATNRASSMRPGTYTSPDIKKYLDSVEHIRAIYNDNTKDLETQRALTETAAGAKVEGIKEEAYGKMEKTSADQARSQQLADIAAKINFDLGVDGNSSRIADKALLFHQLNDQAIGLKSSLQEDTQKLQEEIGVNFTDDPLRWLGGIFTIPQLSDKIEAKQHQVNSLDNEIAGVFHDIQGSVAAAKDATEQRQKAVPAITAAQEAAEKNIIAADAAIKVGDADLDLAGKNTAYAGKKFAEAATLGAAEHAALTAQLEDARLKFEESSRAIMKADSDAKAKLMVAKLAMDLQDREQIDGILRIYEKRTGKVEGTWNYTQFMRAPEELRNYITGRALGYSGTTVGNAYYNMKDVQERYAEVPGPNLSQQQRSSLIYMHEYATQLLDPNKTPEIRTIQGKEEQRAFVIRKMNERYDQLQQNPTSDPQNNPFYEATPREDSLHSPAIAQSKVGKLLEPFIKGQVQPDTAKVVATLEQGAANPAEAAQMISQYYQLNLKVRNSMSDYLGVGYQLKNATYYWRDSLPGSVFSKPQFTDLTKPEDVTRMLLKRESLRTPIELPKEMMQ